MRLPWYTLVRLMNYVVAKLSGLGLASEHLSKLTQRTVKRIIEA